MPSVNYDPVYLNKRIITRGHLIYVRHGAIGLIPANVIIFVILHILYLFSLYWMFTHFNPWTQVWNEFVVHISGFGLTAGAHRLWSHGSYKAKDPLRMFLAIAQAMAGQDSIYNWARDHRIHHKYSDTDGDPHNVRRGVFFSHCGWLIFKKHPLVLLNGSKLNFSDLEQDWIVKFQHRHYYSLVFIFGFLIPVFVPIVFWGELFWNSFFQVFIARMMTVTHAALMINSFNHRVGSRTYNRRIEPGDNIFVSFMLLGEGYHNFHHTFPWDYASSEIYCSFNHTKRFIDFMERIGQAYDLKKASDSLIQARKENAKNVEL